LAAFSAIKEMGPSLFASAGDQRAVVVEPVKATPEKIAPL